MKTQFRHYKSLVLTSLLSFGAASLLSASAAGTDILHLNLTKSFTDEDETSDATGSVRLKFHQQGRSTVQSLELNVLSLDSDATYALLASKIGISGLTEVDQFTTDADGNAKIRYTLVENGNGKVHKPGKGRLLLPEGLNQVSHMRRLEIAKVVVSEEGSVVLPAVLLAEIDDPEQLNYLVKRDISTDTVPASLRIQANDQRGQFRLTADNLIPSTDYWLVLNGPVAPDGGTEQVFTTDAKGKLAIRFTIENPLDVLTLRKVQLRDRSEVGLLEPDLSASLVLEALLP